MKVLSPEVAPFLHKFATQPCMEYCCLVGANGAGCYLDMLDKMHKRGVGLFMLHLLPVFSPYLIVEM